MYALDEDDVMIEDLSQDSDMSYNQPLIQFDEQQWDEMLTDCAATVYASISEEVDDKIKVEDEYVIHFMCGVIKALDLFSDLVLNEIHRANENLEMEYKPQDKLLT